MTYTSTYLSSVFSLKGRSCLLTGGSKGIGRGIAEVLFQAGANVLIVSRSKKDLDACVEGIRKQYAGSEGRIESEAADVTSLEAMARVCQLCVTLFGGLDILVANAGIYPPGKIETLDEAGWHHTINANLTSTFLSTKCALPFLKKSSQGRVIVTSSITGHITGLSDFASYGASKSGQVGFVRSAAVEFAPYNITVNALLPGNTLTDALKELGEEYLETMRGKIPLGRLGAPQDMGKAVLFLASGASSWVTGTCLVVDGGQTVLEG